MLLLEAKVTWLELQPGASLRVVLTGHPDKALAKTHEIAAILLSPYGPWRITNIRYNCGNMVVLDSDGEMEVLAGVKEWQK